MHQSDNNRNIADVLGYICFAPFSESSLSGSGETDSESRPKHTYGQEHKVKGKRKFSEISYQKHRLYVLISKFVLIYEWVVRL